MKLSLAALFEYHDGIEYVNNVRFKSEAPDEIVKEFLNKQTEQFTLEVSRRMYITEQATSLISRNQMTVVLTQTLGIITNTFLVKPQFEGNHEPVSRMAYSGLDAGVDFWIVYKGIIILLSFRNEVTSISSSRVGKKTTFNWLNVNQNLDKVKYTGRKIVKYIKLKANILTHKIFQNTYCNYIKFDVNSNCGYIEFGV